MQRERGPQASKGHEKYRKAIILRHPAHGRRSLAAEHLDSGGLPQAGQEKSLSLESAKLREQAADISVKQAKSGNSPTVSASIQNTLYDHPFVHNEDHYRLNLGISGSYTLWDGGATSLNVEVNQLSKEADGARHQADRTQYPGKRAERLHEPARRTGKPPHGRRLRGTLAGGIRALRQAFRGGLHHQEGPHAEPVQRAAEAGGATLGAACGKYREDNAPAAAGTWRRRRIRGIGSRDAHRHPDSLDRYPRFAELKATSRNAHPGLKSDSISIRAAKKNTEVAARASSITVTLGANSSTGLQAWESGAYKDQLKYGWQNSISLGINIPIIDGGSTNNKVLQAQVSETESQVSMQETAKNLENNIEKLYLNAVSADMQWKAAILQVEAENEALLVAEEQRNAGALTYTDYLTQKNNLEKAQVTLVNAKYTSLLARKVLDLYQGKLD